MAAKDAIADGMERAAPKTGQIVRNQGGHTLEHLPGSLIGKREEQDVRRAVRRSTKVCDAVG